MKKDIRTKEQRDKGKHYFTTKVLNIFEVLYCILGTCTFLLVLGQGYVYEGIWPSDEDRHFNWTKRASHTGEKW